MKNINRYKTEIYPIKDAMHWPLTNLDNEYAKLRNNKNKRRVLHQDKRCKKIWEYSNTENKTACIQKFSIKEFFLHKLELC